MARFLTGERIGRRGRLSVAAVAIVCDDDGHVLLTRRQDNGLWCLPGGIMEPGESVAEAVAREVLEETGLVVTPVRLVGIYSDPNLLVAYPDGSKYHPVVLCFQCEVNEGRLRLSDETTDVGFFPLNDLPPVVQPQHRYLTDAQSGRLDAFIR